MSTAVHPNPSRNARVATGHPVWRVWVHGLLVLFMLLAQHGAWHHGLSHLASAQTQAKAATDARPSLDNREAPCPQCLAFAAMADTLADQAPATSPLSLAHACGPHLAHTPHLASPTLAYRSRAPPLG